MWHYLIVLLPLLVMLPCFGWLWCLMEFMKRQERYRVRNSPLTRNLLRPPGHSLQNKLSEVQTDILSEVMVMLFIPVLALSGYFCFREISDTKDNVTVIFLASFLVFGFLTYRSWVLLKAFNKKKHLILGLQGELFTGEELNQLMLEGCRVYHDVPFPYGNIDHVVVSCSGVHVIETKLWGKHSKSASAEVTVDNENGILRFPDRNIRIPTRQLETQKRWLQKHLTSATGQRVEAESMLALPGWFIKSRVGEGDIFVFNPERPKRFFLRPSKNIFTPRDVQVVAHQLEQLCRDVEPSFRPVRKPFETDSCS